MQSIDESERNMNSQNHYRDMMNNMASKNNTAINAFGEDVTRRDSIYKSDLEGEDMQTQTVFEPFKTSETFAFNKANKGLQSPKRAIPQTTFQFDESKSLNPDKKRSMGIEHILNAEAFKYNT